MIKYIFEPLIGANPFFFNEKKDIIQKNLTITLDRTYEETIENNNFIIDSYQGSLAYYNKSNEKLFFVLFTPNCEFFWNRQNLFLLNSIELFSLIKQIDSEFYIEDYVGFGSFKFGLDIYCPNFTDDKNASIETISIATKGYFESIINNTVLDVYKLLLNNFK